MTVKRNGILLAGNVIADYIKTIDTYPTIGMLSNVTEVSRSVGGCVPNTAINLAKIDPTMPLFAAGRVGDDENGRFIIEQLNAYGISTEEISVSPTASTSFSDAMSLRSGERTFFHCRGANSEFGPEHITPENWTCRIAHFGYVLLLDRFDQAEETCGTVMAKTLQAVQALGIKTSLDAVSDSSGNFPKTLIPALRYCDYVILNEIESCSAWGLSPRTADGRLDEQNVRSAIRRMAEAGVKEKIIVHAKEAAFICNVADGQITVLPSLKVPAEEIVGSTGAGDAFCAASLYGLYHGYADRDLLEFASAAAVCNLTRDNAVDGMKPAAEVAEIAKTYPRLSLESVVG